MRSFINKCEDSLIGILLVAITLLVFIEVVARFGFNTGIHWAQEATLLLAGWMVLLGASWALRERAHIGVDFLVDQLSARTRPWVIGFGVLCSLLYCGLFAYGGWVYLGKMKMIGLELEDIAMPKWIASLVMVLGFVLLAYRLLELGYNLIRGRDDRFHVHKENAVSRAFDEQEEKA